jgi:hypothetical protein
MDFNNFKQWEKASRETIDFKTIYVDIANGDIISGLLLSQIIFWFLPDKNGRSKLRAYKDGKYWLAKQRTDWYGEIRVSPKQYDRAIKILEDLGLVVVDNSLFDGKKTPFIWLNGEILAQKVNEILLQRAESSAVLPKGKNRFSPKGKIGFDERSIPITENTTENTTEINNILFFEPTETKTEDDSKERLFSFWNSLRIIVHRQITPEISKAIDKALKKWDEETITEAIRRYGIVYHDTEYFFKHKWKLENFLTQKNALPDFLDEGEKWQNYQRNQQQTSPQSQIVYVAPDGSHYKELRPDGTLVTVIN